MASLPEASAPVQTMKRTGRSPWSALTRGNSGAAAQMQKKSQTGQTEMQTPVQAQTQTPVQAQSLPQLQTEPKTQPQAQPPRAQTQTLPQRPPHTLPQTTPRTLLQNLPQRFSQTLTQTRPQTRPQTRLQYQDPPEVLQARVVSDLPIPPVATTPSPALAPKQKPLATTSKITALQREWEKNKQQAEGHDSAASADDAAEELQEQPTAVQPPVSASDAVQLEPAQEPPKAPSPSPAPCPITSTRQTSRESAGTPGASASATPRSPSTDMAREAAMPDVVAQTQRLSEENVLKKMETVITKARSRSSSKMIALDLNARPFLTGSMLLDLKRKEIRDSATSDSEQGAADNSNSNAEASRAGNTAPEGSPLMMDQAPDGKSYYLYTAADGSLQGTKGAPFPPGLERSNLPGQPFICPLRQCRALFPNMNSMASHFHGRHSGSLLNDNGDGTFSKTGAYANKTGTSPGIIVSQNPLPSGAPAPATPAYVGSQKRVMEADERNSQASGSSPLAAPATPATLAIPAARALAPAAPLGQKRSLDADDSSVGGHASKRPRVTPVPLPPITRVYPPTTGRGSKPPMNGMLTYLHKILSTKQFVPDLPEMRVLASLPRVRDFHPDWVEFYTGKTVDPLTYACALVFLTGFEVTGSNVCRRWLQRKNKRQPYPCIVLPPNLPAVAKVAFSKELTCVSGRFYCICIRSGQHCRWNRSSLSSINSYMKRQPEPVVEDKEMKSVAKPRRKSPPQREPEPGPEPESDSDNETASEQEPEPASRPEPARKEIQPAVSKSGLRRSMLARSQEKMGTVLPTELSRIPPAISHISAADLEMEDWEFAPGTIRDEATNERIGFSNAYVTSGRAITVSPDIGFNVVTLKSGTSHHWPVQRNKMRTCSIGSGKVTVKIGGQAFKLGTNGLIVIRPGQSCTVENRLYIDAVIHCHTVQDYELVSDGEQS